jgi:predicted ATPase/class 3 adenylate cyclase
MGDRLRTPEGTIALLFTDIEGSTKLASALGAAWPSLLAEHHTLLQDAITGQGGFIDGTDGDAFFATFTDATAAARAAVNAQRSLRAHPWPEQVGELRVRMGLHVGFVERTVTGYVGLEVHRAARVAAAAHGGQLLLTAGTRDLIAGALPTDALGAYRLKDFPTPELLFCAVIDGRGASAFPPPRAAEVRPTNLPAGIPVLVGRDADIEQIRRAFLADGERLLTLTGRGGGGKTSLALNAGASMLDEHPGGVWFIALSAARSAEDVVPAVASVLAGDQELGKSPLEALEASLRERGSTLLILDNFEHLLGAAGEISTLCDALPELRVLVTSQAPLHVAPERCMPLDGLGDDAALALMERVAHRRGAATTEDPAGRRALLEVARLLDGLPLALELAAARLALLTPAQLLARLRESPELLSDATAGARPDRHRSLRATVQWTLGLLDLEPRTLFTRMGVFAGPVELQELEAVVAEGLDLLEALTSLLNVALVSRVESGDGHVRFALPEAVRQIAAAELDAGDDGHAWRGAHAGRQLDVVWAARTMMVPAPVVRAAQLADAEIAAAGAWARTNGDPRAAVLTAARATVLSLSGNVREALRVVEPLIDSPAGEPVVDCQALVAHAAVLVIINDLDEALRSADRAVELAPDTASMVLALTQRSFVHTVRRDTQAGVADTARAAELARELGPAAVCGTLMLEAQARIHNGELERASELITKAEEIGAPVDAALLWASDSVKADLAMLQGRSRDALEQYASSAESAEQRGDGLQAMFDMFAIANVLAGIEVDGPALEVIGLSDAQARDVGGAHATGPFLLGNSNIGAAEQRLGALASAELKERGSAVAAGRRVLRACELARVHAARS